MMLKLKLQYFGHLMQRIDSLEKTLMLGGTGGQEEKGTTEDEMAGWHHRLDGPEFEWTLGVGDGQGGLACSSQWNCRVRHDWVTGTELNWYVLVSQVCLTLWDPMDYSLPGSSVQGILQARILEWVAIPFSRESSWPRDRTCVSCIGRWILYNWASWEVFTLIYKIAISKHFSLD